MKGFAMLALYKSSWDYLPSDVFILFLTVFQRYIFDSLISLKLITHFLFDLVFKLHASLFLLIFYTVSLLVSILREPYWTWRLVGIVLLLLLDIADNLLIKLGSSNFI